MTTTSSSGLEKFPGNTAAKRVNSCLTGLIGTGIHLATIFRYRFDHTKLR